MTSRQAARNAVMGIWKEYGFVRPSTLEQIEQISPKFWREIEESMLAKDKKMAHSIKKYTAPNSSVSLKVFSILSRISTAVTMKAPAKSRFPLRPVKEHSVAVLRMTAARRERRNGPHQHHPAP